MSLELNEDAFLMYSISKEILYFKLRIRESKLLPRSHVSIRWLGGAQVCVEQVVLVSVGAALNSPETSLHVYLKTSVGVAEALEVQ